MDITRAESGVSIKWQKGIIIARDTNRGKTRYIWRESAVRYKAAYK